MEEKKKEKKSSDNIKKVAIGGVVGVMLGSSGVAAAQTLMQGEEAEGEAVEPEVDVQIEEAADGELHVAHGVENSMSFSEAFEAARAEVGTGGLFHWHGNSYSTFTAEEWDNMSQADKDAYAELVAPETQYDNNLQAHSSQASHSHHDTYQPQAEETAGQEVAGVEVRTADTETPDVQEGVDLRGVEFSNVHQEVVEDGSVVTVGDAYVDGVEIAAADVNNDGYFDVAAVDVNANGQFDDNEYFDISNQGIAAQGSAEMEVSQQNGGGVVVEDTAIGTVVETVADAAAIAQAVGVELPDEVADIVEVVGGLSGLSAGTQQVDSFDDSAADVAEDDSYAQTQDFDQSNLDNIADLGEAISDLASML